MTLLQYIAQGAGIALGFKVANTLGESVIAVIMGALHGRAPELFRCAVCKRKAPCLCYDCPLPCCHPTFPPPPTDIGEPSP